MSKEETDKEDDVPVIEYSAMDIYRTLINEKNGIVDDKEKNEKMKSFIK